MKIASASCRGFSLLEICLVIIVISVIIYFGHRYYFSAIDNSRTALIKFQAATFARSVENLYGQAQLDKSDKVFLRGIPIYFNEKGWPATAIKKTSVKSTNQTAKECHRLWNGIFSNPPPIALDNDSVHQPDRSAFKASSVNGRFCRYELMLNKEEHYFFDYDLATGEIKTYFP